MGPYALASSTSPPPLLAVAGCRLQTGESVFVGKGENVFLVGFTGQREVGLQGRLI